jgi:uncharacterized protein YjgD (DUF1641 family)
MILRNNLFANFRTMDENNINARIDALDKKLDLVLDYVNQQRLKSAAIEDLISDVSIIGKDIYDTSVVELDNQSVEIDPDQLRQLGINMVKNIGNFNDVMELFGSVIDLLKEAGPIANEVIIDLTKKLHEFESKGYFEFFAELGNVLDNVISNFSREDIQMLAENIVLMLQTVKNMTQPEMLHALNNAVKVYGSIETQSVPQYSLWKVMREMRTPEMRSALGFMITFMKNLSKTNN